jgi:hypothetical protein
MAFLYTVTAQNSPWQARHGITAAEYQHVFNELVGQGYRLAWVSGYTVNNLPRFAGLWERKPSPQWVSHHGLTAAQYQLNFDAYVHQGYRLVLVNGYTVDGVDFYCAIWDKSPSKTWVARHGLSSPEYQEAFDDYAGQGYTLTHVSGYAVGSEPRYAAIWTQTDDEILWAARHGLNSSDYQAAFDHYVGQGYRLVLVNGYTIGGVNLYAGIWRKCPSGPWVARHGITSHEYQAEFDNYNRQGYVLRVVSGYNLGQGDRYAAIFEKMAMSGADITVVHDAVTAFTPFIAHGWSPGLSLSISLGDHIMFRHWILHHGLGSWHRCDPNRPSSGRTIQRELDHEGDTGAEQTRHTAGRDRVPTDRPHKHELKPGAMPLKRDAWTCI